MAPNYRELHVRLHKISNKTKITQFGNRMREIRTREDGAKTRKRLQNTATNQFYYSAFLIYKMTSDESVLGMYGFLTSRSFCRVQECAIRSLGERVMAVQRQEELKQHSLPRRCVDPTP